MTRLIAAADEHFNWMLGGPVVDTALRLPPGGVDTPEILAMLRRMTATVRKAHGTGAWMIAEDGEVVGLCSYKGPANADGVVEIGYGIAKSRRERGHATRAVAALVEEVKHDPLVRIIVAETALNNIPSQRVLEANGFARTGTRIDPEDRRLVLWSHTIR